MFSILPFLVVAFFCFLMLIYQCEPSSFIFVICCFISRHNVNFVDWSGINLLAKIDMPPRHSPKHQPNAPTAKSSEIQLPDKQLVIKKQHERTLAEIEAEVKQLKALEKAEWARVEALRLELKLELAKQGKRFDSYSTKISKIFPVTVLVLQRQRRSQRRQTGFWSWFLSSLAQYGLQQAHVPLWVTRSSFDDFQNSVTGFRNHDDLNQCKVVVCVGVMFL
jgi:hypothetical protein